MYKSLSVTLALAVLCGTPLTLATAAETSTTVTLPNKVVIPNGELSAGTYRFAVEDRLSDRAIVRVSDAADSSKHYLLLTVPATAAIPADANGLAFFHSAKDNQDSLRAWKCPDCTASLEFVYPKLEAVKITGDSAQSVLAVDPEYDKLPANLTEDDMKVVTLWLLAPKRVTNGTGEGVNAEKLAAARQSGDTQVASAVTPNTGNAATHARHHLPKTGSDSYGYLLCGIMLLTGAGILTRKRNVRRV